MLRLRFDVFGRRVDVERNADGQWVALYVGPEGKRRRAEDILIPSETREDDLASYLADLCHEWATPRRPSVIRL